MRGERRTEDQMRQEVTKANRITMVPVELPHGEGSEMRRLENVHEYGGESGEDIEGRVTTPSLSVGGVQT